LHGARLKADFAVTRLDSLNADAAAFLTANRPKIETLAHNDHLGADFKIRLTATPPDEWVLRIGKSCTTFDRRWTTSPGSSRLPRTRRPLSLE